MLASNWRCSGVQRLARVVCAPAARRATTRGCQHEVRVRASSHTQPALRDSSTDLSTIPHLIKPLRRTQTRARTRVQPTRCFVHHHCPYFNHASQNTPHALQGASYTGRLQKHPTHALRVHHPHLHDTTYTYSCTNTYTHRESCYHVPAYTTLLFTAQHTAHHSTTPRRFAVLDFTK